MNKESQLLRMVNSKSEETSSKTFSVGGHTYTEQERDRDYYKRHVFSENPYLAMPSVEETKHIKVIFDEISSILTI